MVTVGARVEHMLTPAGDPVMTAKFLVPAMNGAVLERARLHRLLTAAVEVPVTLVSAPAGSGKTVLVSSWVRSQAAPGPVGWVSLDEEDDRPGVFWTYVLAALARAGADVAVVGLPDEPDAVDHALLVRLAARLSERTAPIVLVLDNAETISRPQICDGLDFVVRHAAGRLRLVVVTRVDPGLPLPQYRLEGALAEIRFPELAFPPDEARQLLSARRPGLSEATVQAFSYRTRGWAAGLRLADVEGGEPTAEGQDCALVAASDIAVYFRTEVLQAQPAEVRDFLLATSVARELVPGLATHLSGLREAEATLRVLAQASVFVEAVPGEENCFRYHPLVRDLLTAQLRQEFPVRWRRLNRKAATWLAAEGRTDDAVRQFAAADDWEDAVTLVVRDRAVARLLAAGPTGELARVLASMPPRVDRPEAAVVAAAVALVLGDLPGCDKHLARARELVPTDGGPQAHDLELATSLVGLERTAAAGGLGGAAAAEETEEAVLRVGLTGATDAVTDALLTFGRGCALVAAGDLEPARRTLEVAARLASGAGHRHLERLARARLALAEALFGRLPEAVAAARAALDDAAPGAPGAGGDLTADAALAWVASERGDLGDGVVRVHVTGASPCRDDDVVVAAVLALVRCRLLRARGDLPGALATLEEFTTVAGGLVPEWLEERLAAAAVGVCLAQGRPDEAADRLPRHASESGAVHLLALGWTKLATGAAAESGRLARQVTQQPTAALDVQVGGHLLAAGSALAAGQPETAAGFVGEARALASPAGLRRPFEEAPRRLRAFLGSCEEEHGGVPTAVRTPPAPRAGGRPVVIAPRANSENLLIQPLTEREHEVLGYLDALLPTEEIAARMFVSVNTVKTHVRAILRKLSAERRNEAVRRARELGLL